MGYKDLGNNWNRNWLDKLKDMLKELFDNVSSIDDKIEEAMDNPKIKPESIGKDELKPGSVDNSILSNNSITEEKIKDNEISNKKIKNLLDLQKFGTSKYVKTNVNLFDFLQAVPGVIDSNGVFDLTNKNLFTSAYIPAKANDKFVKNSTIGSQVSLFDSNFKFIESTKFNLNYLTVPNNSSVSYMRVTVDTSEGMTLDNFMLLSGWMLTTYYIPYKRVNIDNLLIKDNNFKQNSIKLNKIEEQYETKTYNLFDIRTVEPIEVSNSGQLVPHAYVYTSDYIPVKPNGFYRKSKKEGWKVSFWDKDKKFIQTVEFKDYLITVPNNTNIMYMRVSVDSNVIALNRFMILEGEAERDYITHSYSHLNNFRPTTVDLKYAINAKYTNTVNLFDKRNVLNGYFGTGGVWVPKGSGGNVSTDYIPVSPNETYSKNMKYGWEITFFDENKRYVSSAKSSTGVVTVPNDAKIRFMCWAIDTKIETNALNEMVLVKGANPPIDYIPYETIKLDSTVKVDKENIEMNFIDDIKKEVLESVTGISGIAAGFSDKVPTTGSWSVGDKVWNTNPKTGENIGWVCTKSGTFGSNDPIFNMFGIISL